MIPFDSFILKINYFVMRMFVIYLFRQFIYLFRYIYLSIQTIYLSIHIYLTIQIMKRKFKHWCSTIPPISTKGLLLIRRGFAPCFVNYKKGCTWLAAASDKVYQLLAHGRWFSPGTLDSSTSKTGHHDIAEILLKVAFKHQKSNQIKINQYQWNEQPPFTLIHWTQKRGEQQHMTFEIQVLTWDRHKCGGG